MCFSSQSSMGTTAWWSEAGKVNRTGKQIVIVYIRRVYWLTVWIVECRCMQACFPCVLCMCVCVCVCVCVYAACSQKKWLPQTLSWVLTSTHLLILTVHKLNLLLVWYFQLVKLMTPVTLWGADDGGEASAVDIMRVTWFIAVGGRLC